LGATVRLREHGRVQVRIGEETDEPRHSVLRAIEREPVADDEKAAEGAGRTQS